MNDDQYDLWTLPMGDTLAHVGQIHFGDGSNNNLGPEATRVPGGWVIAGAFVDWSTEGQPGSECETWWKCAKCKMEYFDLKKTLACCNQDVAIPIHFPTKCVLCGEEVTGAGKDMPIQVAGTDCYIHRKCVGTLKLPDAKIVPEDDGAPPTCKVCGAPSKYWDNGFYCEPHMRTRNDPQRKQPGADPKPPAASTPAPTPSDKA